MNWRCRLFGHKAFRHSFAAGVTWGPARYCFRCGLRLERDL